MFHTLLIAIEVKLYSYNPSTNFHFYLHCGKEFYYFNNHFTTITQGCHNSARLWTPCTNCHNLMATLSQPYTVAARLLQPSYFRMGIGMHIWKSSSGNGLYYTRTPKDTYTQRYRYIYTTIMHGYWVPFKTINLYLIIR